MGRADRLMARERHLWGLILIIVLLQASAIIALDLTGERAHAAAILPSTFQRTAFRYLAMLGMIFICVYVIMRVRELHTHNHLLVTELLEFSSSLRATIAELESQRLSLSAARKELQNAWQQARTDPLTGLANRRCFESYVGEETARAQRYKSCFSVCMMDLDNFKRYNDLRGHPEGDRVLQEVTKILATTVRDSDLVARYGGEEFCALLLAAKRPVARKIAERLRHGVARDMERFDRDFQPPLTISVGIATYPDDGRDWQGLLLAADIALYRAKRQGRNRVCVYSESA